MSRSNRIDPAVSTPRSPCERRSAADRAAPRCPRAGAPGEEAFALRFSCRRSGNCCARPDGVVRVAAADVARIAAWLGTSESAFRSRYLAASGDRLIDGPGARCVFLEDGRTTACRIYPVRPQRCRSWPFWEELRRSPRALREAVRLCPGLSPGTRAED